MRHANHGTAQLATPPGGGVAHPTLLGRVLQILTPPWGTTQQHHGRHLALDPPQHPPAARKITIRYTDGRLVLSLAWRAFRLPPEASGVLFYPRHVLDARPKLVNCIAERGIAVLGDAMVTVGDDIDYLRVGYHGHHGYSNVPPPHQVIETWPLHPNDGPGLDRIARALILGWARWLVNGETGTLRRPIHIVDPDGVLSNASRSNLQQVAGLQVL